MASAVSDMSLRLAKLIEDIIHPKVEDNSVFEFDRIRNHIIKADTRRYLKHKVHYEKSKHQKSSRVNL